MEIAPVIEICPYSGGHSLIVLCPYCKKKHTHGEQVIGGRTDFGTRISHCAGLQKQEYRVVLRGLGLHTELKSALQ